MAPGLRLGWMYTKNRYYNECMANWGVIASGGGLNPFTSSILATAIEKGFQENQLRIFQQTYKKRADALCDELERQFPLDSNQQRLIKFKRPEGGFFLWIELPKEMKAEDLRQKSTNLKDMQVDFHSGTKFGCQNNLQNFIRLSFTFYNESDIQAGVKILAQLIKNYNKK